MKPTVILTRPKAQSEDFAAELLASSPAPVEIIHSPLLEISYLPFDPGEPDAVIFSSVNGVAASQDRGLAKGLTAWCVGGKTAAAAEAAGFDAISGPGDAKGLIADIIAANPSGNLAHIRGKHTRGEISKTLSSAGLRCADVIAYDQIALRLTDAASGALHAEVPVIFPLFSPRTATILNKQGPFICPLTIVALSDAVKDAVAINNVADISVAKGPTAKAMLQAVLAAIDGISARL